MAATLLTVAADRAGKATTAATVAVVVAVDPLLLPLGSVMDIPAVGLRATAAAAAHLSTTRELEAEPAIALQVAQARRGLDKARCVLTPTTPTEDLVELA